MLYVGPQSKSVAQRLEALVDRPRLPRNISASFASCLRMNSYTRRRFLLDLAAMGGIVALVAGHGLQARPLPPKELKKKLDDAIDKAFSAKKEPPRPLPGAPPSPVPHPMPGKVMQPPVVPLPGRVVQPPKYPPAGGLPAPQPPQP